MDKLNIILVIVVAVAFVLAMVATYFAQRHIHNQSINKRRKRLLILFTFAVLAYIPAFIFSINSSVEFRQLLYLPGLVSFFFFVGIFLYAFFRKENDDNSNKKQ